MNTHCKSVVDRLREGNSRFAAAGRSPLPCPYPAGSSLAGLGDWSPWVALLTCSDLGVDPNRLFGLSSPDLYAIQTAAEVVGDGVVDSALYAHAAYGIDVLVVLGHTPCGVVERCTAGLDGYVVEAVQATGCAVSEARCATHASDTTLCGAHARRMARLLRAELEGRATIEVVAAHLDEGTGRVAFLTDDGAQCA